MPTKDADISRGPAAPDFVHLPAYARFLLEHKLREFSEYSLKISRELEMPLLRYFESYGEEKLIALSMEGNEKLFTAIIESTVVEYIDASLRSWRENQLPQIQSDDVVIEDVSRGNFTRRQSFRHFLPQYSSDPAICLAIMEEADRFTIIQEELNYKTLFDLKQARIQEHHHFIDRINSASPGIIYVQNLVTNEQIYSNHKGEQLLGYTDTDFAEMQSSRGTTIIHPADRSAFARHRENMMSAADAEVRTIELRVLSKAGQYLWHRAYETVFRRDASGTPVEIIGISIDVSHEKEATLVLEQREQQLREAQEIAGMGSFDWDLQGRNSNFSEALLRIFEMEESSNLADFLEFVHPADRESVRTAIAEAIAGNTIYECEYRYRKNGPEKVIWSRGKVMFDGDKPSRMRGTVMDVTQRHDMLKRLARSEQLHKQAQALTHLGNWSWSLADNKVEWSDEMYRIFGLQPQAEPMSFDRFEGFIHPDDRQKLRQALHTALDTKHADDYLMRVLTDAGDVKYVEGKSEVLCDEQGKPYKIAGSCQDITAHYLLNERLRENEEASRQLINSAPEGIVVIDQESQVLLWNPKAAEIFGWTEEEITGKTLMDTIIPENYAQLHAHGVSRLKPNAPSQILNRTIEVEAMKKDGEMFYISLNISRSYRSGRLVYIAFIRDISEERANALKLEEQRNQLAKQNHVLERTNQELTAFNYISSHDLKEPVRKIKIFGNIVANESNLLSVTQRGAMDRILSAADHMERLIEALIVFSRANAGERTLEPVDLNAVVDEIKVLAKDRIDELSAKVQSAPLPEVQANYFQIQQLFENLIGNALKYSKPGVKPEISISAARISGRSIGNLGADPAADYYRITVSDNGIGFEPQYASRIFEVFQRLHGKDAYSGTGIGLAICKKIVQNHDGFITAAGEPGKGASFDVYLPVA